MMRHRGPAPTAAAAASNGVSPLLVLLGIPILVIGFVVGLNPLLVVAIAGFATGLLAGLDPLAILAAFGKAFVQNRYIGIVWLVVPVIGLLERCGLRERAQMLIARIHAATTGRVLLIYLVVRQVSAALGLTSLGGHAQMVRPLIAPMAEAAEERHGSISENTRMLIRANAAAVDNIGVFFGEDVFIAIGSILLIKGFLQQNGIVVAPLDLAVWAIPTAVLAFIIHGTRLFLLDRRLKRGRRPTTEERAAA
jgi:uncharacterized membrane protein